MACQAPIRARKGPEIIDTALFNNMEQYRRSRMSEKGPEADIQPRPFNVAEVPATDITDAGKRLQKGRRARSAVCARNRGRPSNRLFAANGASLVQTRFEPRSFVAACQARGIGALRSAVGGGQSGARDRPI